MKLFRSSLLMMGELAAFGWFILRDISFLALLPLIPLGAIFYFLHRFDIEKLLWLNGFITIIMVGIVSYSVATGVFNGNGFWMLVFLMIACSLLAVKVKSTEWARISGWWMTSFLLVFIAMIVATVFGIKMQNSLPPCGEFADIIVFYFLAFLEPLSMGKEYRASPLSLGILLLPFGVLAYLALGEGAFNAAEYPYLSVWSGVSISTFHHLEGIILCLFYGAGTLRLAHFLICFSEYRTKNIQ